MLEGESLEIDARHEVDVKYGTPVTRTSEVVTCWEHNYTHTHVIEIGKANSKQSVQKMKIELP